MSNRLHELATEYEAAVKVIASSLGEFYFGRCPEECDQDARAILARLAQYKPPLLLVTYDDLCRYEMATEENARLRNLCHSLEVARDERDAFEADLREIGRTIGCEHIEDGLARCVDEVVEGLHAEVSRLQKLCDSLAERCHGQSEIISRRAKGRPTVTCLCGSSRFYEAFQKANYEETMAGRIVLSIGFYPHSSAVAGHGEGVGHDSAQKKALDELHFRKIEMADEVLVLNCDWCRCKTCKAFAPNHPDPMLAKLACECKPLWGRVEAAPYIGQSTRNEIEYAKSLGKKIRYLNPVEDDG